MKLIWLVTRITGTCAAADPDSKVEQVAIEAGKTPITECHIDREDVLTKNVVIIKPGETVCVDIEVQEGSLVVRSIASEHWPYPIGALAFSAFKTVSESGDLACR